jgi:biopolymer transport protein ExbB
MGIINLFGILAQVKAANSSQVDNIAELLLKGGIIMIPIILLSLFSIYLFIERFIYIRNTTRIDEQLIRSAIDELAGKRLAKATEIVQRDKTSAGRILESGLSQTGKPVKEMENYMESAANLEIALMEKDTGYLGIIAGVAPMLGFIGTISGVIKIFYNISLSDNISIGIIAGGLYQKMICSGTGLIVGVIAYSCYHILQMMIDRFTIKLQRQVNDVLKVI